jgi:hypothetical protein
MCKIDLSKAKVGDMVKSVLNGWGEIKALCGLNIVAVEYPHSFRKTYWFDGKNDEKDLYPEIVEWLPAKRKRRKEITVYVNVYKNGNLITFKYEGNAKTDYGAVDVIAVAVPCTGYYEVEE